MELYPSAFSSVMMRFHLVDELLVWRVWELLVVFLTFNSQVFKSLNVKKG